jgi:hypothetical protein
MNNPNTMTITSLLTAKSHATNNVGSSGLDIKDYIGQMAVRVNVGVKTAGDNDGTVTVQVKACATNALASATNITTSTSAVTTTNNTAASGTIVVDTRAEYRYLFVLVTLAGTNSPAYPVSVEAIGWKQSQ